MKSENLFAFVLMPFDSKYDDIYQLGIKQPASDLGIRAERVDEQIYQEGILERIYKQIEAADIIVADVSGKNPNVLYEIGYAHGKGKICILLTSSPADIPFDLKHKRHVVYDSIGTLKNRLTEELIWAQSEIENIKKSNIQVKMHSIFGNLLKTKYKADGEVEFKIDLLNESNKSSSQLEAIYFYTGKGWHIYQDEKECPSSDSDIPKYIQRHFLRTPIRCLHKGTWAQLAFTAKKTMGWALHGEELHDNYKIQGACKIRLATSDGNFDYELPVNVDVNEVPF